MKRMMNMKGQGRSIAPKLLWALLIIQIVIGVFSLVTLNIGRGIAVFGSAALIYLGMMVLQQLKSIRELLSYSAVQNSRVQPRVEPTPAPRGRVNVRGSEELA